MAEIECMPDQDSKWDDEAPSIPVAHPELLEHPGLRGDLARMELYIDIAPYVRADPRESGSFIDARLEAAAFALQTIMLSDYSNREPELSSQIADPFRRIIRSSLGPPPAHEVGVRNFEWMEYRSRLKGFLSPSVYQSEKMIEERVFVDDIVGTLVMIHALAVASAGSVRSKHFICDADGVWRRFRREKVKLSKTYLLRVHQRILEDRGDVVHSEREIAELFDLYAPVAAVMQVVSPEAELTGGALSVFSQPNNFFRRMKAYRAAYDAIKDISHHRAKHVTLTKLRWIDFGEHMPASAKPSPPVSARPSQELLRAIDEA